MSTKSLVLSALESSRGRWLSGQELASLLGVSRTAVWKAVKALQEDGCGISAVPNLGYRLDETSDMLSPEGVIAALPEHLRSLPVFVFDSLDSTNTQARRMATEGACHGTVILAEEQSAGRGRSGNQFYSPRGSGLYMSAILRPREQGMADVQMLTVAAAVAACRAVESVCGISPQIKWVNDLYVGRRKVCGILTEAVGDFETGQIETIVLGAGINCTTTEFPPELDGIAGSLGSSGVPRCRLAAVLISQLLSLCDDLGSSELIAEYRSRSMMLGQPITFGVSGDEESGVVLDISRTGGLIVRDALGRTRTLSSGQVRIRGDWNV